MKAARSALRAVDRELPKRAKTVLVKASEQTAAQANTLLQSTPGGSYPARLAQVKPLKRQTDVGVFASRTRRTPILHAFEYGASAWHLPIFKGRGKKGSVRSYDPDQMSRRVLPPPQPRGRNKVGVARGYVVAPTMQRMAPRIDKQLHDELKKLLNSELDRRGIPRG